MRLARNILISLLVALAAWSVFSWPLPRFFSSGIPSSAQNIEKGHVRSMIPGDHLQILYRFRLFADMLGGKTPFFHNLYEFNSGDDAATHRFHLYYPPFSIVFALANAIGGPAFGWNLTGFLSLWLTYALTWALVRRYTEDSLVAGVAALIALTFPYLWGTLLGGSPTGLAMLLVPAMLLGLDIAVREDRAAGGLLAGLAILCAAGTDRHVAFFGILLAPFWCALAFAKRDGSVRRRRQAWRKTAGVWLPVAFGVAAAGLLAIHVRQSLSESHIASGRTIMEVAALSPRSADIFHLNGMRAVYVGYFSLGVLAVGLLLLVAELWRGQKNRRADLLILLAFAMAVAVVIALAMGTHGPLHGKLLALCRELVPPYSMVRQPAKILCLLPSLLAVGLGIALSAIVRVRHNVGWRRTCLGIFAVCAVADYGVRTRATVCRLVPDQPAYQAVVEDASRKEMPPRALILPLWPGDSHWTSVYEHYAMTYRIRMINGYQPAVPTEYLENVYRRFEGANAGEITGTQIADLWRRGFRYVLLHEDLFPEKVSPFPVGFTLERLLVHPRLRLLKHAGPVWAFEIVEARAAESAAGWGGCRTLFGARRWEAEAAVAAVASDVLPDAGASEGAFMRMAAPDSRLILKPTELCAAPELRLLLHARGAGALRFVLLSDGAPLQESEVTVDTGDWTWLSVPLSAVTGYLRTTNRFERVRGSVDLDAAVLAAGDDPAAPGGQRVELPAACFFHAGYTDPSTGSVVLRQQDDPEGAVLYAKNLILDVGEYEFELVFESPARKGTLLGTFGATGAGVNSQKIEVRSGAPARGRFLQQLKLSVRLEFCFSRDADITLNRLSLQRLK
jgi:hypothetical protein